MLAKRGLVVSAGKMSGLWSGQPNTVKLAELDVICAVLDCDVQELLVAEPETVSAPTSSDDQPQRGAVGQAHPVMPKPHTGRSLPPR